MENNLIANFLKSGTKIEKKSMSKEELLSKIDYFINFTKLKGFIDLINGLFLHCEFFEPDPVLCQSGDISEEELKTCVKKAFLEIQDYYL